MPSPHSAAAVIEAFHLSFLEVLRHHLRPENYVLKGGANLRYFFGSVRYSEDIDLDVIRGGGSLEERVGGVLESKALEITLRPVGITVAHVNAAKQTSTTRRWKIGLDAPGHPAPVPTKIEFSDRNGETRYALESVGEAVVAPYALRPPTVQHYLIAPAIIQKVQALAGRSATQVRDVFDLELLLRRAPIPAGELPREVLEQAAERGLELDWASFERQVLPFLDSQIAQIYDETVWEQMQSFVIDRLMEEAGRDDA